MASFENVIGESG